MSIRSHIRSQELRYDHEHSPRKQRMFAAGGQFQPSRLYNNQLYKPTKPEPEAEWIGKFFIPEGSIPANPEKDNYVREYDVMKRAGKYSYRVLYAHNGQLKSKAAIERRPGQMNLIINTNNRILSVEYY